LFECGVDLAGVGYAHSDDNAAGSQKVKQTDVEFRERSKQRCGFHDLRGKASRWRKSICTITVNQVPGWRIALTSCWVAGVKYCAANHCRGRHAAGFVASVNGDHERILMLTRSFEPKGRSARTKFWRLVKIDLCTARRPRPELGRRSRVA
jgi:hypothetical protein